MGKSIEAPQNPNQSEALLGPQIIKTACRKRQRYNLVGNGSAINNTNQLNLSKPLVKCSRKALLPPMLPEDQGKKTLVLDLDETLVHSSFKPVMDFDFVIQVEMEMQQLHTVYVLKRPGVEEFLKAMAEQYELVVFTAGLKQYADAVLDIVDAQNTIKYRLYRDSCKLYMGGLVKDLCALGRDLRKVVIVDNSPHCYLLQPKNAVPIVSFIDDRDDHELLDLIPFLSVIAELDNVTDALGDM